jgi:hypothetical protein
MDSPLVIVLTVVPTVLGLLVALLILRTVKRRMSPQGISEMVRATRGEGLAMAGAATEGTPVPGSPAATPGGGQDQAAMLMANGRRARAQILAVRPTGVIINQITLGVELTFRLTPLDGGAVVEGAKNATISQVMMPRVGDVWPAWIDPADPAVFAVAMPNGSSPEQVALFREFGIPHPLDGATAGAPPAPGDGDRIEALERLARLHGSGALSDAEFAAEKERLLKG